MAGAEGLEPSALGFGDRLKLRYIVVYATSDNIFDQIGAGFVVLYSRAAWIMLLTFAARSICHSWMKS